MRARESSDPRFDLAFRPSNGRSSNPVRLGELTGAHHPVDGRPSQASAPLDFGACQQSIPRFRRHDTRPFRSLSTVSLQLPRDSLRHRLGSIAPAAWTNSWRSEWVRAVRDERSELGSFSRMGTPSRHSDPGPVHSWVFSESSGQRARCVGCSQRSVAVARAGGADCCGRSGRGSPATRGCYG